MAIYALGDLVPMIATTVYVHPDSVIIGDVEIGDQVSVWPCAVLRGDYGSIQVGSRTSIQDGTIVHCTPHGPTIVGSDCVVGHDSYLEGCVIEERCLIGSSSLILAKVVVEHDAVVAAGAVVREKTVVRSRTVVAGVPATERGEVSPHLAERIQRSVKLYISNGERFAKELRRID